MPESGASSSSSSSCGIDICRDRKEECLVRTGESECSWSFACSSLSSDRGLKGEGRGGGDEGEKSGTSVGSGVLVGTSGVSIES